MFEKTKKTKSALYSIIATGTLFAMSLFIYPTLLPGRSFAEEVVDVTPTLSISPISPLTMTIEPGTFSSATQNITVSTTNYTGYTLTLKTMGNSTNLSMINDAAKFIPTISLPEGADTGISSSDITDTAYGYSIDGVNYLPVPDTNSTGATLAVTSQNDPRTGSHDLTFGVKTQTSTAAGLYTNTFQISAVANPVGFMVNYLPNVTDAVDMPMPNPQQGIVSGYSVLLSEQKPQRPGYKFIGWSRDAGTATADYAAGGVLELNPEEENAITLYAVWVEYDCAAGAICYDGNGDDGTREMENQTAESDSSLNLHAPNYSRAGYGFTGWNTERDGSGDDYGPNQTVSTGDLLVNGLLLYAQWQAASGTMQGWSGCSELAVGETIALTDERDGNTYTVTKLADGKCWTTENLRLDLSDADVEVSAVNTNNPTDGFVAAVSAHPASSDTFCTNSNADCIDRVLFNTRNINRSYTAQADGSGYSWFSYGVYYNWHTATAGNGTYATSAAGSNTSGDLCPAGWHLPSGYGANGDYATLHSTLGGNTSDNWRAFPNNFVMGGFWNGNTASDRGESGDYHASTANNNQRSNNLWLLETSVKANSNGAYKYAGQTIRCIAGNTYTIRYNNNTEQAASGIMTDQIVNVGVSSSLAANAYQIADDGNTGYWFTGWNTEPDGTGESYADGAEILDIAGSGTVLVLYAQWREITYADVSIEFAGVGVTGVNLSSSIYGNVDAEDADTIRLVIGEPYQATMNTAVRYEFDAWSVTGSGELNQNNNPGLITITGDGATITATGKALTNREYMQEMPVSSCTEKAVPVLDNRDGEEYLVQRLADGQCWMLDNLRLDSEAVTTELTSENTNIAPGIEFALPESGTTGSYVLPQIYTAEKETAVTTYGEGAGLAGVYYNYCAASAGTVCSDNSMAAAENDICPAGWHLPDGDTESGDVVTLYSAYGNKVAQLRTALSVTFSGYLNGGNGAIVDMEQRGYFWTATAAKGNKSHVLNLSKNGSLNITGGGLRSNALPIRCVMNSEKD